MISLYSSIVFALCCQAGSFESINYRYLCLLYLILILIKQKLNWSFDKRSSFYYSEPTCIILYLFSFLRHIFIAFVRIMRNYLNIIIVKTYNLLRNLNSFNILFFLRFCRYPIFLGSFHIGTNFSLIHVFIKLSIFFISKRFYYLSILHRLKQFFLLLSSCYCSFIIFFRNHI